MLHLHGGSVVLDKLRATGLPGAFLEWTDVLCQGPTPGDVSREDWLDRRADFLDTEYGGDGGRPSRPRLAAQDAALTSALAEHDEIVLWFSGDWFCQAILACLLATRLAPTGSRARASLVSLDGYPGVDDERGCTLAFLSGAQLQDLFTRRAPVTAEIVASARRAWAAVCAADPRAITAALRDGLPPLPLAAEGLGRHLRQFPSRQGGVNHTERSVLEAVRHESRRAADLFPVVSEREPRRWITDQMFASVVRRLAAGARPLLRLDPPEGLGGALRPAPAEAFAATRIDLTEDGRAVLAGAADWIAMAGVDRWVGGVHLTPESDWRWDEQAGALTRREQVA